MRGGECRQAAETGQRVDLDLGKVGRGGAGVGRGLVGVGDEDRTAAAVLVGGIVDDVAVGFAARGIGGDEHHAVLTGELACVAVHELCRVFKQQGLELLRRFLYGAAGDVDRAARVAAVVKAVVLCVALGKVNGVRGDGEFFCGNILQRGNRAAAMVVDVAVEARRAVLFKLGRDGAPVKTARIVA